LVTTGSDADRIFVTTSLRSALGIRDGAISEDLAASSSLDEDGEGSSPRRRRPDRCRLYVLVDDGGLLLSCPPVVVATPRE
jgi:hypothetical protein